MTTSVCTQLAAPDAYGVQACLAWTELAPIIPDLTPDQVSDLCTQYLVFILICAVFRQLRKTTL